MPFESDNIEIMTGFDTKEIIDELFDTLLDRYQMVPEQSIKGSNFVFDGVQGLF